MNGRPDEREPSAFGNAHRRSSCPEGPILIYQKIRYATRDGPQTVAPVCYRTSEND